MGKSAAINFIFRSFRLLIMSNKIAKPIISIPVRVNQRAIKRQEKIRIKELEEAHSRYSKGDRKFPIIKCRRSELDHFRGQTYAPFKGLPMASEHWMSRSTIGDFFSFVPFRGGESRIFSKRFVKLIDKKYFSIFSCCNKMVQL